MNIEDEASREDKLKQLNQLVGDLSFPPLPPVKKSPYYLWYVNYAMCIAWLFLTKGVVIIDSTERYFFVVCVQLLMSL